MIDTVRLEIKNIQAGESNNLIYRELYNKRGSVKYKGLGRKPLLETDIYFNTESENIVEVFRTANHFIPSSNYKVTFSVNYAADSIFVEFSLPKYFYGNNIAQFIDNPFHSKFQFGLNDNDSFEHQQEILFQKFATGIRTFFNKEFGGYKIDYENIYLRRIDFCYNQFFADKESAKLYLKHQMKLGKKYLRDSSPLGSSLTPYGDETFYFKSKDYSFKIYHKGPEFAKHDAKEYAKIVRSGKFRESDLKDMQEVADKILRYEITFRAPYLSYLFNTYIFRRKSKDFMLKRRIFNRLKTLKQDGNYDMNNEKFIKTVKEFQYRKLAENQNITVIQHFAEHFLKFDLDSDKEAPSETSQKKSFMMFEKEMSKLIATSRNFSLRINPVKYSDARIDINSDFNNYATRKDHVISKRLFDVCILKFREFIKDFQVKGKDNYLGLVERLEAHNREVARDKKLMKSYKMTSEKGYLNPNKYKLLFLAMDTNSLNEIRKKTGLSKSSYYRMRNDLKKLGITENHVMEDFAILPRTDYRDYYIQCVLSSRAFTYYMR